MPYKPGGLQFYTPHSFAQMCRDGAYPGHSAFSQLTQEIDHRGIDFRRAFLLGPMTAVPKNDCSTQARQVFLQTVDNLLLRRGPIAGYIERRNTHLRTREWRQQLPISIDVTVPVHAAAKPGTFELADVEINIGFR